MRLAVLLAVTLALLAGCRSLGLVKDRELTYGQVQSIHTGLTAAQVLDAFGPPSRVDRAPDGKVRVVEYAALDGRQGRARLVLGFDEREVLVDKRFTGPITKP